MWSEKNATVDPVFICSPIDYFVLILSSIKNGAGAIRLWDVNNRKVLYQSSQGAPPVLAINCSSKRAIACCQHMIYTINLNDPHLSPQQIFSHPQLHLSPESSIICSLSCKSDAFAVSSKTNLFISTTGNAIDLHLITDSPIVCLTWIDNKHLQIISEDGTVQIYKIICN